MLQNVLIFGGINDEVLFFLLDYFKIVNWVVGQEVFYEGDYIVLMFIIEEGEVVIFKQKVGQNCLMVMLGEGECFGEMVLFDYMFCSVLVVVYIKCSLIEIIF